MVRGVTVVLNSGKPAVIYGWTDPHGAVSVFRSGNRRMRSSEIANAFTSSLLVPPWPPLQSPEGTQPSTRTRCGPIRGEKVKTSTPRPRNGAPSK